MCAGQPVAVVAGCSGLRYERVHLQEHVRVVEVASPARGLSLFSPLTPRPALPAPCLASLSDVRRLFWRRVRYVLPAGSHAPTNF